MANLREIPILTSDYIEASEVSNNLETQIRIAEIIAIIRQVRDTIINNNARRILEIS